ncbi:MAG: DUF1289 domain-containing protein [Rhodobacteraceae bacterium]|nr:DUF1289 domain-containing protein [Paracoccaceae bacterium]
MKDDIWKRDEIDSPCQKICVIHPDARICIGCNRSLDEIARWSNMKPDERQDILAALPARTPLLRARRRGRAQKLSEKR